MYVFFFTYLQVDKPTSSSAYLGRPRIVLATIGMALAAAIVFYLVKQLVLRDF